MSKANPPERIEGAIDPFRSFIEHVPHMVSLARLASNQLASSYRNFNVGSALFSFYPELGIAELFHAGNTKRQGQEKVCAEQKILGQAAKAAQKISKQVGTVVQRQAIGLVIVGTTDVDQIEAVTNVRVPTLWSCETCVSDYELDSAVSPNTILLMTGRRAGVDERYQVFTAGQMRDMYIAKTAELDGQQTQFGIERGDWQQRVTRYDELVAAEAVVPALARREPSHLAQLAMLSALPNQ